MVSFLFNVCSLISTWGKWFDLLKVSQQSSFNIMFGNTMWLRCEEQMQNQNNVNSDICCGTDKSLAHHYCSYLDLQFNQQYLYHLWKHLLFCCSLMKAQCPASIKSPTRNTNMLHPSDLNFYLRKAVISKTEVSVTCATLVSPDAITRRLQVPSV